MEKKTSKNDSSKPRNNYNHWKQGLILSMQDSAKVVIEDNSVVAIEDKYPKAAVHYLVCPKSDIQSLEYVKSEHLDLLKHMAEVAYSLCDKHSEKNFMIGYHAVPSMNRLHLHVVSDDFNSKYLKTKRHWNSFHTNFFRPSEVIIDQLKAGQIIHLSKADAEDLLRSELKCHKCDFFPKNMPQLKQHILHHLKQT